MQNDQPTASTPVPRPVPASGQGGGFSPDLLAPWLADLKRQIALRQAMP